jgi:putative membrane protein
MIGYGWDMGGAGWLWALIGLVVLVALVVLVVWAVNTMSRVSRGPDQHGPPPLDILRERFARGEITKEQFEEAKRTLGA